MRGTNKEGMSRVHLAVNALAAAHASTFNVPNDCTAEVLAKAPSYFERQAEKDEAVPVRTLTYAFRAG